MANIQRRFPKGLVPEGKAPTKKDLKMARYTVRVRRAGRHVTKTFSTKAAAETWARAQETAIESGEFHRPTKGVIFADLVDAFLEHRKTINRPLGKTAAHTLGRLKDAYGLEAAGALTAAFWRKHAMARMAKGAKSQTAAQDLLYASAVVRHAARDGVGVDPDAPRAARTQLQDEGLRVSSRPREGRISDAELGALLAWIDDNAARTSLPIGDIVRFALATAMRRGEILAIRHEDLSGRVILVRNRKHPRDHDRVDQVPLMQAHAIWPRDDPIEIIRRQPTKKGRIFPYLGDTLGYWFEEACTGAKLKGVVFHLLRHESLSRYAERGLDPMRLQLIGGHRDLRHLARYVKLDAARLASE